MPSAQEIQANQERYLIQDSDREAAGKPAYYPEVHTYTNSTVTPLVDGDDYFADFECELNALSGSESDQGILIAGWNFATIMNATLPSGTALAPVLEEKASKGANVRIMIWVSNFLASANHNFLFYPKDLSAREKYFFWPRDTLKQNMQAIYDIRSSPDLFPYLSKCIVANTLNKPLGACHIKFAVLFDAVRGLGYTGGIDFANDRYSNSEHLTPSDSENVWHDIQAKAEGDAVQGMYDFYRQVWNELIDRHTSGKVSRFRFSDLEMDGVPEGADQVPERTMPVAFKSTSSPLSSCASKNSYSAAYSSSYGLHCAQLLRTIPKRTGGNAISFAEDGIYETQLAIKKAIEGAQNYIYIEDQDFWSKDILEYLHAAIIANSALRVIMLTGLEDPTVPGQTAVTTQSALYRYLLDGLTQDQRNQIVFYQHGGAIVHSKIYIIDDAYAFIGSANAFNRSLYTDLEHSICFIDNSSTNTVVEFRARLWAEHFGVENNPSDDEYKDVEDLEKALNVWKGDGTWGSSTASFKLPLEASSYSDLTKNREVTENLATSLIPAYYYYIDAGGNYTKDFETAVSRHYLSTPSAFSNGGKNFIEDALLPTPDSIDLSGGFIIVMVSGPNDGAYRRITAHEGSKIFFDEMEYENDSTSTFSLVQPKLQQLDLADYTSANAAHIAVLRAIKDAGSLH